MSKRSLFSSRRSTFGRSLAYGVALWGLLGTAIVAEDATGDRRSGSTQEISGPDRPAIADLPSARGLNNTVSTFAVYDGDLYAAGYFTKADGDSAMHLARWDGFAWHEAGGGISGNVRALLVHDGKLIVGGDFSTAGGLPANCVASWDGTTWSTFGDGIRGGLGVSALCIHNGNLIAGGFFDSAGSVTAQNIAIWNGSEWNQMGPGLNERVAALAVYEGELYVGGLFYWPIDYIVKWTGSWWAGVGGGIAGEYSYYTGVRALRVYNGSLIAAGWFNSAGGVDVNNVAAWDGTTWSALGNGLHDGGPAAPTAVRCLNEFNGSLIAGGCFNYSGDLEIHNVALWDSATWSSLGTGTDGYIAALAAQGQNLYAGGRFSVAGGGHVQNAARWDGSAWRELTGTRAYDVTIEATLAPDVGVDLSVSVDLSGIGNSLAVGSFDFLIGYDTLVGTLTSVQPGQLLQDCGWEYFTYAADSAADCGGEPCSEGTVRIMAIADVEDGDNHPDCLADYAGELVRLDFHISEDSAIECLFFPISFGWFECSDNTVAPSTSADTIYISDRVYDPDPNWPQDITADTTFPTRFGAPSECLSGINGTPTARAVNYFNGGVEVACLGDYHYRGDVNLNEIPYEIADAVVFANFFLYGLSAFQVDYERQIETTEINADGLTLTLGDYVYLVRIILGDALPYPSPPRLAYDSAIFTQDTIGHTVSVEYSDSLRAVYLIFDGPIDPVFDSTGPPMAWNEDSAATKLLMGHVLQFDLTVLEPGQLFTYTGDAQLVAASADYDGGLSIPVAVEGMGDCCVRRGDVDGDPESRVNIVDVVRLVNYLFVAADPPPCFEEANVDDDLHHRVDLSDLIYLIDFLFRRGQTPSSCR